MRKWFVFVVAVFLLAVGVFFYLKHKLDQQGAADKLIFNADTQKWEKYLYEDPVEGDREAILSAMAGKDGINDPVVLRGYFDNYDEKNQTLTIKAIIPFTQSGLFEIKQVKLFPGQSISCAPAIYIDPNTGVAYATKDLVIPVEEGQTLTFHTEQLISFTEFVEQSDQLTFMHLQLTAAYQQNTNNYVKKILAIGLCE